jgi:alkylation response protein AidB-like acyl-CoA dehydrogenase
MDFALPDELEKRLALLRDFMQHEVIPLESRFLAESFGALMPSIEAARRRASELGLWVPQLNRSHGGMGLSLLELAHFGVELGKSPLGHIAVNAQAPDAGNMEILSEFATAEQKSRWLEPLVAGRIRSCFAMTERDCAGSNPVWMETTARRDGDHYVLSGRKWFATGADGAALCVLMAVTDPEAEPHRRASLFLVPSDTPGYRLVRNIPHMGHAGDGWASHGEIALEGCRVPAASLLGEQGGGFAMAQARLGAGRIQHAMRWVGICERALDILCRRAAGRPIAPGRMLGTCQAVRHSIADCRVEIDAAKMLVLQAAWKMDRLGQRAARTEISAAKFFAAGVLGRVLDRAIQAHGALGVSDDLVLAWYYRNERAARIYDGPDEVHKDLVSRQILKEYGLALK